MSNPASTRAPRRSRAFALLVVAALGLTALSPVAAATAADTAPVITDPGSQPGHPEIVQATVVSDSAVTSVSVVVETGSTDRTLTLTKQSGSDLWVSDPLVLSGLGQFDATITAVDAEGDVGVHLR